MYIWKDLLFLRTICITKQSEEHLKHSKIVLLFYLHQELWLVCRTFKEGNQHGEHLTLFEIITNTKA